MLVVAQKEEVGEVFALWRQQSGPHEAIAKARHIVGDEVLQEIGAVAAGDP